jgi:hypothetical protein
MKKLSIFILAMGFAIQIFAQSPNLMSYQAIIRNASNQLVTSTVVGMRISILQGSVSGPAVMMETQTPTTNFNGLVSIEIGNGAPVTGSIDAIDWSAGPYFIKLETDPNGGTSYSITSTTQLLSVPYALYAATSGFNGIPNYVTKYTGTGTTIDTSQIYDDGNSVGLGTTTPTHRFTVSHSGSTGIGVNSTSGFSVVDIDGASGDAALRFAHAGVNQWNVRNRPADDYFEIFELGGGGSRVVIQDATGNVGIGETTSPSYKLDVLHGGSTGIRCRSSSSFSVIDIDGQSGDAALRFAKAGVNQWNVRNNPATDDLQFFELGGGGERMRIENTTGNVVVVGNLSKGGGSFKIDHPLDPENKYLYHSFVESPDMMNIYNGNVVSDITGKAVVQLPDYFEALNMEFRYQLTVIGTFDQAIISKEVANNSFEITTSNPHVKVSWQVTGIRHDAFANKNRIPNTVDKEENNKGKYLHPDAFNLPVTKGINYDATLPGNSSIDEMVPVKESIKLLENTGSVEK